MSKTLSSTGKSLIKKPFKERRALIEKIIRPVERKIVLSFAFVAYVLAFVPPGMVNYKISTQGIIVGEDFYFWHFLDSFWFKEKDGVKVLHIQTHLRFPAQLMLVLGTEDEEKVKKIVARFLPFHEIPYKSWMEKWSESLQKHFPLENIHR